MATTSSNIVYDTHAAIQRLAGAGMPESHAKAVIHEQTLVIERNLAIRQGLADTYREFELLEKDSNKDLA